MSRCEGPLSIAGSFERLSDVDGVILMKYMLLVHHDEEVFGKFSETKRQQMLEESVQLTHQLHAKRQISSASPLHPASTAAIVRVRDGKQFRDRRSVHRDARADRRLFPDRCQGSRRGDRHRRSGTWGAHRNRRGPAGEGDRGLPAE